MKHTFVLICSFVALLSGNLAAQSPILRWAKSGGGIFNEFCQSIAVDASGNSYVTGSFNSPTITFSSTVLNKTGADSSYDVFIVKYDAGGNVLWAKDVGDVGDDFGYGIAVDHSGNVYVTGSFGSPTITFGVTVLTNANTDDSFDMFIAKYDTGGNVLWAKKAGGSGYDDGNAVAVDASGNSYVLGDFESPAIGFSTDTLRNADGAGFNYDIFITKYDPNGNLVWVKGAGGTNYDYPTALTVDASGNSYVTGFFKSTALVFDQDTLATAGGFDMFVVKYNANGNVAWAKSAGNSANDFGYGIAVDGSGNSYVTGGFLSPTITFGLTTLISAGGADAYVVKYDSSGNVVWAKNNGGAGGDFGGAITVDAVGNSYVTGEFRSSTITFGSTTLTNVGGGGYDVYIAKFTPDGNVVWARSAGGTVDEFGYGVGLDAAQNVFVSGYFSSPTFAFGSSSLTNKGMSDVFILKIANVPDIVSVLDIPSDQGGQVRIKWNRSSLDIPSAPEITSYSLFRKSTYGTNASVTSKRFPSGVTMDSSLIGYDYVATVPAFQLPQYQMVVPTLEDSTSAGIHRFDFLVAAQTTVPGSYYVSVPDSGYSVDNLAPIAPNSLTAQLAAGAVVQLGWDKNTVDPDVKDYNIYRSSAPHFTPSTGTKIGTATGATFNDSSAVDGQQNYYRVTTEDIHGNQSLPSPEAAVFVTGVSEASKGIPKVYRLEQNYPNPFNPTTLINYALPKQSFVRLTVYNALGQEITTLVNGMQEAGNKSVELDGNNLPSGMYFYKITAGTFNDIKKMILLK